MHSYPTAHAVCTHHRAAVAEDYSAWLEGRLIRDQQRDLAGFDKEILLLYFGWSAKEGNLAYSRLFSYTLICISSHSSSDSAL
jgi:hypothetical protein